MVEVCKGMFSILHVCMHFFIAYQAIACVAWRFCRAGRRSGGRSREKNKKLLPPQSPRGFSALARLYYLARPTKTAMLRRLIKPELHSEIGAIDVNQRFFGY